MKKTNVRSLIGVMLLTMLIITTGCQRGKTGAGRHGKWHFIVVGDSRGEDVGINSEILAEVAAEIVRDNPDFVLFPGDLVTGSKDDDEHRAQLAKWRKTMQPVYDADIEVYAVRGNHDKGSKEAGRGIWDETFSGQYALPDNGPAGEENLSYSVKHKNALIVAFDSYLPGRPKINQPWIDETFADSNLPHVFVMGHEPAFAVGHKDCLDDDVHQRNEFFDSIAKEGGRTYFCGHDHYYNHISVDNDGDPSNDIHQLIVGTGGAPLRPHDGIYGGDNEPYKISHVAFNSQYGYVVVVVDGAKVTLTWYGRVGANNYQSGDTWSYTL